VRLLAVLAVAAALAGPACDRSAETPAAAPTTTTVAPTTSSSSTSVTSTTTALTTTTSAAVGRYVFPIAPDRGVSYARTHAGYMATDVFAPCGAVFVAVTDGRLDEVNRVDRWDPKADNPALRGGLWVSIVGIDGVRYYGSHLSAISAGLEAGGSVAAGQEVGRVGHTGNAAGKPCHVHFGISPPTRPGDWAVRRGVVWPWPYLDSWRDGGQRSPRDEVLNVG
jgi:murein DD-endopeptidase MepM/ murein hydrolase activator NlpD